MYLFMKCKFVKFLIVLIDNKGWFPINNFMILSFKLLFSFDFWEFSFLSISSKSDIIDSDFFFIVNDLSDNSNFFESSIYILILI